MKVVFFGTSSFAAGVLNFLANQPECSFQAIVTRPDRPKGRDLKLLPSAVKIAAHDLALTCPIFQPLKASSTEFEAVMKALTPELFIVVAYGEILKDSLLQIPPLGAINIHASLLPKYRGASPIHRAIMHGEKETGISVIKMVSGMDAGPILNTKVVPIAEDASFESVEKDLLEAAKLSILESIRMIHKGDCCFVEQDHAMATYAPKLTPEDEKIHWELPAQVIHNQIRALSPVPGAWCFVQDRGSLKRLKIKKTYLQHSLRTKPGMVVEQTKNSLVISCGEDSLQILEVQLEGKKTMPIQEFLQGRAYPLLLS